MFRKNSRFQHDLNIPVHVFDKYKLVSIEKIDISVLPQLSDYLDFNEMQYVLQKDLIYRGVYNHIFRGISRRLIDRHSRSFSSWSDPRQMRRRSRSSKYCSHRHNDTTRLEDGPGRVGGMCAAGAVADVLVPYPAGGQSFTVTH